MTTLRALPLVALLALGGAPAFAQPYQPAPPPPPPAMVAPIAPPPLREELVPPPPRPAEEVIWQPGHWRWEQRRHEWAWIPGHYVERPHRLALWESGHWVQRPYGWTWVPGHWR
jgi:hypothetical protein